MAHTRLAVLCMSAILFQCVLSFSVYGAWNEAASFLGIKRSVPSKDVRKCSVRQINGVDQFDAKRFSGDWYEMAKTRTSVPFFKSAIWRFQPIEGTGNLAFFFSARVESGHCLNPFAGEMIASNTNPGTLRLSYDGLKARVEEELKLIYTDYDNIAVFYACRHVMPETGSCHSDAVFASVISRHHTLTEPTIFSNISQAMSSICMDNQNFIPQNGTKSCNLDELDARDYKDTISDDQWPVCKHPAVCTLACPPCCYENEKGCIICDCQKFQMDNPSDHKEGCSSPGKCGSKKADHCQTDIAKCPSDCHVVERIAGCKECICTEIGNMAPFAAPVENSNDMYTIQAIGECPTTCRTVKIDGTFFCNCTNQKICKLPEEIGECKQSLERYYFNAADETCRGFVYGGCNGNENNFESIKECYATCKDVCDLSVDIGEHTGVPTIRYYYNRVTESCTEFSYEGLGGNENNFETESSCRLRCPERKIEKAAEKARHNSALSDDCPMSCDLPCQRREDCVCDCGDGTASASLSFACLMLSGALLLLQK